MAKKKNKKNVSGRFAVISIVILLILNIAFFAFYFQTTEMPEEIITGKVIQEEVEEEKDESQTYFVQSKRLGFSPNELVIEIGDSVVWTNEDVTDFDVIISRGRPNILNAPRLFVGEEYSFTFNDPGEFEYISVVTEAAGRVVVE